MDLGDILAWAFWGLIVGAFARLFKRGSGGLGFFRTILVGIAGALLGGFVASLIGLGDRDQFDFGSFLIAVIGSFIVLTIYLRSSKKSA